MIALPIIAVALGLTWSIFVPVEGWVDDLIIGILLGGILTILGIVREVGKLLAPKPTVAPEQVIDDDPLMREVVSQCWNSGKPVVGRRNDDGSTTVSEAP